MDVQIDGSQGEGGGQMLRSSMALSIVSGRSVRLFNIRAGRARPGLLRQHLTAVTAAAEVSGGTITGAELGSSEITFEPGIAQGGDYLFRIGSAGSAMLVLQTVLPPLLTASRPSTIVVEGGTHNMAAPPFEFFQHVWVPLINQMGPQLQASIRRHGFFPAGGGCVAVSVQPSNQLQGFDLLEHGARQTTEITALVANLPESIGEREVRVAARRLSWPLDNTRVEVVRSNGPGNVVFAKMQFQHVTELCTAFGKLGVSAERVGADVANQMRRYLKHAAPVGEHLADQLLLPLALSAHQATANHQASQFSCQRGGQFRTGPLSQHTRTHIEILQRFLNIRIDVQTTDSGNVVTVSPQDA